MTARVLVSGDKRNGFIWQLVDSGKMLESGREMTEVQAVNAGQGALIAHMRKRRRDRPWSAAAKAIHVNDT